jgi:hypothetical protein
MWTQEEKRRMTPPLHQRLPAECSLSVLSRLSCHDVRSLMRCTKGCMLLSVAHFRNISGSAAWTISLGNEDDTYTTVTSFVQSVDVSLVQTLKLVGDGTTNDYFCTFNRMSSIAGLMQELRSLKSLSLRFPRRGPRTESLLRALPVPEKLESLILEEMEIHTVHENRLPPFLLSNLRHLDCNWMVMSLPDMQNLTYLHASHGNIVKWSPPPPGLVELKLTINKWSGGEGVFDDIEHLLSGSLRKLSIIDVGGIDDGYHCNRLVFRVMYDCDILESIAIKVETTGYQRIFVRKPIDTADATLPRCAQWRPVLVVG